ncbi:MAG: CDGSH iron-sulfur domain-containing protein [Pirellulaceae bacterium]
MTPRIRVRDDGPLILEGAFEIVDAEGKPFPPPTGKPLVALCRCGRSESKPFCDGAHKVCGFSARQRAPDDPESS